MFAFMECGFDLRTFLFLIKKKTNLDQEDQLKLVKLLWFKHSEVKFHLVSLFYKISWQGITNADIAFNSLTNLDKMSKTSCCMFIFINPGHNLQPPCSSNKVSSQRPAIVLTLLQFMYSGGIVPCGIQFRKFWWLCK